MPFSLSGRVAAGADDALSQVLQRRLQEAVRLQQEKHQNDLVDIQRQQLEQTAQDRNLAAQDRAEGLKQRQQVIDLDTVKRMNEEAEKKTNANRRSDIAGVLAMPRPEPGVDGMSDADKYREVSGLAVKAGADPLKVIDNLKPIKPEMKTYTKINPVTGERTLVPYDANAMPPEGFNMGHEPVKAEKPEEPGIKLTPAGLDMASLLFLKTGQMPTLGMGDRGNRQAIMNRAAELTPEDIERIQTNKDIAGNKQDFQANTQALKTLQVQRDSIGAFEQTASKNIDVFLDQAGKVVDTGSPLANSLAREFQGTVMGDKEVAAYKTARRVAINEIAKITSNPTLAGQLSDTARNEVEEFNPQNATVAQTVNVMRILKAEMGNRISSLDNQLVEIKKRGKTPAKAADDDALEVVLDPKTGKYVTKPKGGD